METLGERPVWSMSGGEMLSTLDALDAELARLQTYRLHVIAGLEDAGYAEEIGAHDTAQLLAFRYRLDRPEARRDVRLARNLAKYGAVAAALPSIDVPIDAGPSDVRLRPAQAEAIVSALERVPATVPIETVDVAEQELVGLARHLSPGELRRAGQRVRDLLDTDGPEPEEGKAYARESLTLSTADRGVKFHGYLANENAELLRSLVHAGARPHKTVDGELDPRSRDKRQADALTAALTIAAASSEADPQTAAASAGADPGGSAPQLPPGVPGFGAKANITVTIDLADLRSATADAVGDVVYGDALSAAAIRRLACDAKIIPLVLGSNSEPLDVGRSERLVTRALRRALNTRDKGCVVCGAPPVMCDAHHLISWIDGGETKISNLVLLCRRHHLDLHAGHWKITITNGVVAVSRPTWADPPPHAQPADGHTPINPRLTRPRLTPTTPLSEAVTLAIWGEPTTPATLRSG